MPTSTIQAAVKQMHNVVITANDNGELPTEIELLSTGYWQSPTHGEFEILEAHLPKYIENFENDVRAHSSVAGIPIDFEHETDGGAGAWIKKLFIADSSKGNSKSLWGKIEYTSTGKLAIKGGVYKFISPEFAPYGYFDPEGRAPDTDCVLLGAGFTNRPLFKGLHYVKASDSTGKTVTADDSTNIRENSMQLEDIKAKAADQLTDEEKQFVAEHKSELTADERTKFGLEETPATPPADEQNEGEKPEVAPEAPAEEAPVVAASEKGTVSISASELDALKASAAKGELAHKALEDKRHSEDITSLVFSASDKGQKFKSDQKDAVVSFYLSCSDKQKEAFKKLAEGMPAIVSASDFAPVGDTKDADSTASAQASAIIEKANAIVAASDGKTSFSEAIKKVANDEPKTANEYEQSLKKGN